MGPAQPNPGQRPVERVQVGVRLEKRLVKVLKGLAEFEGITLGQLIEKIVLHSFEPVPGHEGELCASPHGTAALAAVNDLKRIYGLDYDVHATRRFTEASDDSPGPQARPAR
jgi:hypothetical protein